MAISEQVTILAKGTDEWNKWRADNPSAVIDLREANLAKLNLRSADLRGADLDRANLSRAHLQHAQLGESSLKRANLSNASFIQANLRESDFTEANLSDADLRNSYLVGTKFTKANFRNADLSRAELCDLDLSHANLSEVNLSNADLRGANLHGAILQGANLGGAKVSGANLRGADFEGASLQSIDLSGANIANGRFTRAKLTDVCFEGQDLIGGRFSKANLVRANLRSTKLMRADFSHADLRGADLTKADLRDANLIESNLGAANLDHETHLSGAATKNCTIDRYQLERLSDYGGLTTGNRMVMNIKDSVAQLRASYSGFWQWIHLAALIAFIFPYAWFVVKQWSVANFFPPPYEAHIPLWKALATYIYNGGLNWQSGPSFHWSFVAFLFLTFYNGLRAILLWKTKQLELHQESSGLPAMFSLEESVWGVTLKVASWSFAVYLVIGLSNLGHFLTQEIPLDPSL